MKQKAIYIINAREAETSTIDLSRIPDDGEKLINVCYLNDKQFLNKVFVYWNGQLLYNDLTPKKQRRYMHHDVARSSTNRNVLIFAGKLKEKSIVQICLDEEDF